MKTITQFLLLSVFAVCIACQQSPSLEKYYVKNQEEDNFIVVNIPADLLVEASELSPEQRATVEKIEKANILAYTTNAENNATYQKEKTKIENILSDEKYKLLMKFGSDDNQFKLMYLGESDAIDEMIVYGSSGDMGFGVARILGDDLTSADLTELVKMARNNKDIFNAEGMEQVRQIFKTETEPQK